jgi:hypothetical protein
MDFFKKFFSWFWKLPKVNYYRKYLEPKDMHTKKSFYPYKSAFLSLSRMLNLALIFKWQFILNAWKKIFKNENIKKMFRKGKSNEFVVKPLCSELWWWRKSKFRHFSLFSAKIAQTGRGSAKLHVFQVTYIIFLMSEKEVDKISYWIN